MKTIRWVLAHEPIELFLRAARKFKATMEPQGGFIAGKFLMSINNSHLCVYVPFQNLFSIIDTSLGI